MDSAIANVSELPPQETAEDDDLWLNIDEVDFNAMMEAAGASKAVGQRSGSGKMDVDGNPTETLTEDDLASHQANRLKDFADKVEKFVEGKGDLEGARFEEWALFVTMIVQGLTI